MLQYFEHSLKFHTWGFYLNCKMKKIIQCLYQEINNNTIPLLENQQLRRQTIER